MYAMLKVVGEGEQGVDILAGVLVPQQQVPPSQRYILVLVVLSDVDLDSENSWQGVFLSGGSDGLVVVLQHIDLHKHCGPRNAPASL